MKKSDVKQEKEEEEDDDDEEEEEGWRKKGGLYETFERKVVKKARQSKEKYKK